MGNSCVLKAGAEVQDTIITSSVCLICKHTGLCYVKTKHYKLVLRSSKTQCFRSSYLTKARTGYCCLLFGLYCCPMKIVCLVLRTFQGLFWSDQYLLMVAWSANVLYFIYLWLCKVGYIHVCFGYGPVCYKLYMSVLTMNQLVSSIYMAILTMDQLLIYLSVLNMDQLVIYMTGFNPQTNVPFLPSCKKLNDP